MCRRAGEKISLSDIQTFPLPVVMTTVERTNAQLAGEPEYNDGYFSAISMLAHICELTLK
jgi:hypothetical protein